jgi:hypothetical protein
MTSACVARNFMKFDKDAHWYQLNWRSVSVCNNDFVHEIGSRATWRDTVILDRFLKDNNLTSYVIVINDMFFFKGVPLLLYLRGQSYYNDPDQDSIPNLSNLQKLCTSSLRWNYVVLGRTLVVFCKNGLSPCGPFLQPSRSTWLDTLGTNPRYVLHA